MRQNSTIYFILFALVILGAFASMAQYAYGLKVCGIACLGFALTFLYEIFVSRSGDGKNAILSWAEYIELGFLIVVSVIFAFKNFSLEFPYINDLQILSLLVLVFILWYQAVVEIRIARSVPGRLDLQFLFYYGIVAVAVLSFLIVVLFPLVQNQVAAFFLLLALGFMISAWIYNGRLTESEENSPSKYMGQLRSRSFTLVISCVLIYSCTLLQATNVLPPLYRGMLPKGYQHLVDEGNKGKDQKKSREFAERYEKLLKRHSKN